MLHPNVFFGQIWCQKLKFSKLTKIWYSGTLLYPYVKFNVYFSEIFYALIFFLSKFCPKIWISSNWQKFHRGVHCYMLIAALMFIFSKFFHSYFLGKFVPKIWSSSNWLKFGQISFHLVIPILTELHRFSMLNFRK